MAYSLDTFIPQSAMGNSNAARQFSYTTADDAIAAVKAANYFDAAASPTGAGLLTGDVILVTATDGTSFIQVDVTAGVVTTVLAVDFA